MTKFYCDGCGVEIQGSYTVNSPPYSMSLRFMEGIFCTKCEARGIVLKEEFIKETNELRAKYVNKLKAWLK